MRTNGASNVKYTPGSAIVVRERPAESGDCAELRYRNCAGRHRAFTPDRSGRQRRHDSPGWRQSALDNFEMARKTDRSNMCLRRNNRPHLPDETKTTARLQSSSRRSPSPFCRPPAIACPVLSRCPCRLQNEHDLSRLFDGLRPGTPALPYTWARVRIGSTAPPTGCGTGSSCAIS